ncbi:SPOR domain-containing protein, partial [Lysobacter sp. A3-1-A15]
RARLPVGVPARVQLRREPVDSGRGWRVLIPPQPSLEAAQALAERIGQAGYEDYLVMREGEDANAIALGRYGGESTARRRVASLEAAGFDQAVAQPLGDAAQVWLDLGVEAGFDADAAQSATGAPRRVPRDCAQVGWGRGTPPR